MQPTLTSDLIRQVRNQIRELNKNGITDQEIIDTLNRGQQRGMEVMTRNWPYNYIVRTEIVTDEQGMFTIPEEAKGNRIVSVEVGRTGTDGTFYKLKLLNFKDVTRYRNLQYPTGTSQPVAYYIQGRKAEVFPKGITKLFIYYIRNPESLVKDSGYIFDVVTKEEEVIEVIGASSLISNVEHSSLDSLSFSITTTSESVRSTLIDAIASNSGYKYIACSGSGTLPLVRFSTSTATIDPQDPNKIIVQEALAYSLDNGQTFINPNPNFDVSFSTVSGIYTKQDPKIVVDYLSIAGYTGDGIDPTNSFLKESYFNIIDAQTGLIKASFQSAPNSEEDNDSGLYKMYLKVPFKSSVLNQPIDNPDTIDLDNLKFTDDDYICSVKGSCIPELDTIVENFIIQYSVAEIKRSLGQDFVPERDVLKQFEQDVKRAYVNRDKNFRINIKTRTFYKGRWQWSFAGS